MEELRMMGFADEDISVALRRSNGNLQMALEILLGGVSGSASFDNSGSSAGGDTVIQLGISQYTFSDAGKSACTAISASVMQFLLQMLKDKSYDQILDQESLCDCIFNGIMKFNECHSSEARDHVAVDELAKDFLQFVQPVGEVFQGLLTDRASFQGLVEEAQRRCKGISYIGIVITKPPETVTIILPGTDIPDKRFFFFDSHSRPEQGLNGSYLVIADNVGKIIQRLDTIFPSLSGVDSNNPYSYMYNMFEASFFQAL